MSLWLPYYLRKIARPPIIQVPAAGMRARGYFEFFKTYPNGVREKVAEAPNIITNNGQNLAFTNANPTNSCFISTGTATPAATDTQLTSPAVTGSVTGSTLNTVDVGPPYQRRTTITYRFAVGTLNGNYTEVGVGQAFNNLFSRALIVTAGGTPTPLNILPTEQLDVTYTLCDEVITTDVPFSVTISGTPYTGFFRRFATNIASNIVPSSFAFNAAVAYSGTLPVHTSSTIPTGSLGGASSITPGAYTAGNFFRDHTIVWNTTTGNGSIRSVIFGVPGNNLQFGMQFDSALVKTNLQSLTLVIRLPFVRV